MKVVLLVIVLLLLGVGAGVYGYGQQMQVRALEHRVDWLELRLNRQIEAASEGEGCVAVFTLSKDPADQWLSKELTGSLHTCATEELARQEARRIMEK